MASLSQVVLPIALLCLFSSAIASDPSPLQDFCVAELNSKIFVNGFICKDPKKVTAIDFFYHGLDKPGNTNNPQGFDVTMATVNQLPGLNTLGISMVRSDYGPYGLSPPHTHPRGTEILTVIEGSLFVGFITSNPNNTLISKTLVKGDVFVFPQGLIHFQQNIAKNGAIAIAALSSQNPGVITIANPVFGSKPPIPDFVLMKAFQVEEKIIDKLEAPFKP